LRNELIHPDKIYSIQGIRFSPDGGRLLAGDLPGAVVALWDLATGKLLTTVEAGFGMRGGAGRADYFFPSPDWQTLFTWRSPWTYELLDPNYKRLRWDFQGDLRAWDLATGRLLRTFRHQPARGIGWGKLSPDGTTFDVIEELPGVWEGGAKEAAGLWDLRTGRYRALPNVPQHVYEGYFSPDGRTLAMDAPVDDRRFLRLFDAATGREKGVLREKGATLSCLGFLPDGKLLVNACVEEGDEFSTQLQWWDPATGRKVASSTKEKDGFSSVRCSPDGKTVAAVAVREEKWRLLLFGAPGKPPDTVPLMELAKGEGLDAFEVVFAPGGRWLAVLTQVSRADRARRDVDIREAPQALVRLIDVAAGKIRETLVCPPGYAGTACFSPDGKTLATSVSGRVLLWDLTEPPLEARASAK
jgi:WD40 repeat protein